MSNYEQRRYFLQNIARREPEETKTNRGFLLFFAFALAAFLFVAARSC